MTIREILVRDFLDELGDANCRFVCGSYFIYFDADTKFAYTNINNTPFHDDINHIDYKGRIIFKYSKDITNSVPEGISIYDRDNNMIVTMSCTGMMSWISKDR